MLTTLAVLGVGYIAGTLAHEVAHIVAVLSTRSQYRGLTLRPLSVKYTARTESDSEFIKATPVLLSPLLAAGAIAWASTPTRGMLAFGFLAGFVSRTPDEYTASKAVIHPTD